MPDLSEITPQTGPIILSFGVRYFAFTADPLEIPRLLNPFFPVNGERFLRANYYEEPLPQIPAEGATISKASESDALAFIWNLQENAEDLFRLAYKFPKALSALIELALDATTHLMFIAGRGDKQAIEAVLKMAESTTASLTQLSFQHTTVVQELAKTRLVWPVLKSPHPSLTPRTMELAVLGVGTALFPEISKSSRFNISDDIGTVAMRLLMYVKEFRIKALAQVQKLGIAQAQIQQAKTQRQLTIEEDSALLLEFQPSTAVIEAWWKVADRCLVESYPHPRFPNEIDEHAPALRKLITAKSHFTRPDITRSKIRQKLRERLYSFAGIKRLKTRTSL